MTRTRTIVSMRMTTSRRNEAAAERPMSSDVKAFFQIE